jgi:ABC-type multidrug transport system fused ATPase/permease subunit
LEKKSDEKRSRAQEKESASYILKYAKDESWYIIFGMIFLLGGSVGELAAPFYLGQVISALSNDEFDKVGPYCLQLFLIICVSFLKVNTIFYSVRVHVEGVVLIHST